MRKYLWILPLVFQVAACSQAGHLDSDGKYDLRVLYVGGQPDLDRYSAKPTPEELEASVTGRMAAFETFLKGKFTSVAVVRGADYSPEMSDSVDVTVFDGNPPVLERASNGYDRKGIAYYRGAKLLPDGFDRAALTIGSISESVSQPIGCKNDWYCLCLDAQAHNWVPSHPIFQGPFPVTMTTELCPTPEDAKYYTYFYDAPLPDSTLMWRVQTKGYQDERGFPVGMVARPWGYVDAHDSEYISSGVCAKTIDAVAIGRHGNFLHWGFAASPEYLTDEAKQVLANAIVYISRFNGKGMLVRKYTERIATREYVKELKHLARREPYEERVQWALEAGQTPMTFEEYLSRYEKEAFDVLGTDIDRYPAYYDENLPYFYGGEGSYVLSIDGDCKEWGLDNHDPALLDKAISCLEKGVETERAGRILSRYTLCSFDSPKEWRSWFRKYRKKLFFTESGGWVFMIDGPSTLPGNDPSVRKEAEAEAERAEAERQASLGTPTPANPVCVAARWVPEKGAIELSFVLYPGFHVYRTVSPKDPYIPLSIEASAPRGLVVGDWQAPSARPYGSAGTLVYDEGFSVLVPVGGRMDGPVSCTVNWQSCDDKSCTAPQSVEFNVMVRR